VEVGATLLPLEGGGRPWKGTWNLFQVYKTLVGGKKKSDLLLLRNRVRERKLKEGESKKGE